MSKDQNLSREAEARLLRGFRKFFIELVCTVAAGIINTLRVIIATLGLFLVKGGFAIKRLCGNFGMTSPPEGLLARS